MKAVVVHQYGGPEVLHYEEAPDPVASPGEALVRIAATSVNPVDLKRRSGEAKGRFPIDFPGIIGVDVAGTIVALGPDVDGFAVGDEVFAMAGQTYAELCVVNAAILARIPADLDLVDAAALPLVTLTGSQLITVGTSIQAGQTVLVTGAVGGVGRSAVFTAKERGAIVIAGVRASQTNEAETIGADQIIALDDEAALAALASVDAVADAVGGKTAQTLLAKVKPGGVFASVLGPPPGAADYPGIKIVPVQAKPDPNGLVAMAQAVIDGLLVIPITQKLPLAEAARAHAEPGKGGKTLLLADSTID